MKIKTVLIGAALLAAPVIVASYTDRFDALERFLSRNPLGSNGDYWLVQNGTIAGDRIAVVFGFYDNHAVCLELAEDQNIRHPASDYTCERVR